jgi:DNA-binding transcriptional MerR regulator
VRENRHKEQCRQRLRNVRLCSSSLKTNLKHLGFDLKTIQEILRHAHRATTAYICMKEVSEQVDEAMQRLEKHLEGELRKDVRGRLILQSICSKEAGRWLRFGISC